MDPNIVQFDSRLWDPNWKGKSLYLYLLDVYLGRYGWQGVNYLSGESAYWGDSNYELGDMFQGLTTDPMGHIYANRGPNTLAEALVGAIRNALWS